MIRLLLALERLTFDEKEGKVSYRFGKEGEAEEDMDYLEFIARVTFHRGGPCHRRERLSYPKFY